MMHTTWLWTHIHLLPHLFACSLLQFPGKIVPSKNETKGSYLFEILCYRCHK
ncbi:hypothetical protein GLYMA_08G242450v4 [Glycine max]|nr:hypothetical protein GLYMA_08G242450v4 [Glycine max]KAH1052878.1 hypothetical protein GYH30_022249 [Glycine max]